MVEDQNIESQEWLTWVKQKAAWLDPRTDTKDDILGDYPIEN